ncbi:hypothetical protein ABRP77_15010 [Pectobacterium odoriferum]|uniref:hypothetical protein n=1 Tax=Pectobacterium odoriferum TaxID=78398 RepID=UPI000CD0B450|nr:hypothetical protein [Pectobacterium odoriferum]POD92210.1 hypothetical protein BV925_11295 [Pectobacterium odoriferum]POD96704.1 hypothetical protein BVY05_22425 [Pectobacterium odoriferum]
MPEEIMKKLFFSQGEIIALRKAIIYLKFSCNETESLLYSGSESINSALSKLIDSDDFSKEAKEFYKIDSPHNESFVKNKISKIEKERGSDFPKEIKEKALKSNMYPFPVR